MSKDTTATGPLAANPSATPKVVETAGPLAVKPPNTSTSPGPRPELMIVHSPRDMRGSEMGV